MWESLGIIRKGVGPGCLQVSNEVRDEAALQAGEATYVPAVRRSSASQSWVQNGAAPLEPSPGTPGESLGLLFLHLCSRHGSSVVI